MRTNKHDKETDQTPHPGCLIVDITYATLTNLSTNYLMLCKVFTDVGGIK